MKILLLSTLVLVVGLLSLYTHSLTVIKPAVLTTHSLPTNQLELYYQRLSVFQQIPGADMREPRN